MQIAKIAAAANEACTTLENVTAWTRILVAEALEAIGRRLWNR